MYILYIYKVPYFNHSFLNSPLKKDFTYLEDRAKESEGDTDYLAFSGSLPKWPRQLSSQVEANNQKLHLSWPRGWQTH